MATNGPTTRPTVRIRRLRIIADVETYAPDGTLVALKEEAPIVMLEADFDTSVRDWLVKRGVPPQVLGAAPPQPQSPHPETTSTSSTIAGDILLPHQYATVGAERDEHEA